MERVILKALALTVLWAAAGSSAADEYVSKEKGIAVTFPVAPKMTTLATPEGALSSIQVEAKVKSQTCLLAITDLIAPGGIEENLEGQRDAMVATGGTVLAERYVTASGRPGREIRFKSADAVWHVRFFLDPRTRRSVNLYVLGEPALDEAVARAFLDSFRFLGDYAPEPYGTKDGAFSVMFPGPVTSSAEEIPQARLRSASATTVGLNFSLTVMDSTSPLDGDPEIRLNRARDGLVGRGNKLVSEKKITWVGRPGRDMELAAPAGLLSLNRYVLDPKANRFYMLSVIGRTQRFDRARAAEFLDSFQLAEKK